MADISLVYLTTQLGLETTPGTGVAANKLVLGASFGRFTPRGEGTISGPQGAKLNTVAVPPGDEHTEMPIPDTPLDYNAIVYLLDSAVKAVTPTADGTNGKKWVHSYARSASDVKSTFTVEQGNNVRGQKFAFGHMAALTLDLAKREAKMSGTMRGQRIQDDIAMTGSPTEVAQKVVIPQAIDIKVADLQADLDAAANFTRPFQFVVTIENISDMLFRMNSADTSFINTIEQKLNIKAQLKVGADDADMAFFTNMRAGSKKFIRAIVLGEAIAGAVASQYKFQIDFSGAVIKPYDPADEAGAALAMWEFENIYDPTWAKSIEFTTINTLATL